MFKNRWWGRAAVCLVVVGVGLPVGIASEDLLVCGWFSNNVVRYDGQSGAPIDVLVPAGFGGLSRAHSQAQGPDGPLYVAAFDRHTVLRYDIHTGEMRPGPAGQSGTAEFIPARSGGLSGSSDVKFGPDGHLYVASFNNSSILRYDGVTGDPLRGPLGAPGTAQFVTPGRGGLNQAEALVFGPDGSIYVASGATNEILRYDAETGAFIDVFIFAGRGGLQNPHALLFGPDGHLYVPAFGNHRVLRYDGETGAPLRGPLGQPGTAQFVTPGSGGLLNAHASVFGGDGDLYVSSFGTSEVLRYDGETGAFIDAFVAARAGGINGPIYPIFAARAPGDFDGDGVADLSDYEVFFDCMSGPDVEPDPMPPVTPQECLEAFDFDDDGDIDHGDFAGFQGAFSGS